MYISSELLATAYRLPKILAEESSENFSCWYQGHIIRAPSGAATAARQWYSIKPSPQKGSTAMTKASMGTSTAQNPSSITLAKQIKMKASFSTLLLLARESLAAPNHYYLDGVLLKFDLAIPDVCRNDASHLPARQS
jgi:hypothetical protein